MSALPSRPVGFWSEQVVPRCTHVVLGTEQVAALRRRAIADATGRVVELGYGSGPNLALYPPAVTEVLAVEPSPVARRLAARRESGATVPVHHVGLDGQELPVPDASADTVVSTFTLCTIPEPVHALREVRRVLRPGGRFLFLEHGLAPDERTRRRQRRLTPLQRRLFDGCHLDRAIDVLVGDAGLILTALERDRMPGPRLTGTVYLGQAHDAPTRPAGAA